MEEVKVTVIGVQKDGSGEENRIELVSLGKHYYKNGIHYVLYDDGELSGLEGTSTMLKIEEANVTLIRKGAVMQEQFFAESVKSQSVYKTPFGNLRLSVFTHKLEVNCGLVSGYVDIDYALSIDDQWQSDNRLHIEICEEKPNMARMN